MNRTPGDVNLLLLSLALSACSSPRPINARDVADANDTGNAIPAGNASERNLLVEVSHMPTGTRQRVGELDVTAAAPYSAASGRTCRPLELATGGKLDRRLACTDGRDWFFVPKVFGVAE